MKANYLLIAALFISCFENGYSQNSVMDSSLYENWDQPTASWVGFLRSFYSYDEAGNQILSVEETRQAEAENWTPETRTESTFDLSRRQLSVAISFWDSLGSRWIYSYKQENGYDLSGYLTTQNSSEYDTASGSWQNLNKVESTYDAGGHMLEYLFSHYNQDSSAYIPDVRFEYAYDAGGDLENMQSFNWISNQWTPKYKTEFTFDDEHRRVLLKESILQDTVWNLLEIDSSVYEQGKLIRIISLRYDADGIRVAAGTKIEFSEDEVRMKSFEVTSAWLPDEERWEYDVKREYTREVQQGAFNIIEYRWQDGAWKNYSMVESQSDDEYRLVLNIQYTWDETAVAWLPAERDNYYYSQHIPTTINPHAADHFRAFPNPARDYVAFESDDPAGISRVEFYNMQGKMVMSTTFAPGETVSLEGMKAGYYLYRIQSEGKVFTGKLEVK